MNIFVLSDIPSRAVKMYADKHVVKMPLETAQMLCTAHGELDGWDEESPLYKPTHVNHPCSIWTRESSGNYFWLMTLFRELAKEYQYRYHKTHKSWRDLEKWLRFPPKNIPRTDRTPFALAMPDYCKCDDPVQSYRNYYLAEKQHLFAWTGRPEPEWIHE